MKASEQVNLVYCTTLKFAAALLKRDCHDFLSKNRRVIEWALRAFESYGDRHTENDTQHEPYGSMVLHLMEYDSKHGHTPTVEQFIEYLKHLPHNPQKWGFSRTTNEEHALARRVTQPRSGCGRLCTSEHHKCRRIRDCCTANRDP